MTVEAAQSTVEVFAHGFSAGCAFALVFVYCWAMLRSRRDP